MSDVPILDSVLRQYLAIFKIDVIFYNDLDRYGSMQQLFQDHPFDAVIVYLEYKNPDSSDTAGHYTVMLKRTEEKYEWFEPVYGSVPEKIAQLVKRSPSGTHIDYIERGLQRPSTNTCGRWCIDRVLKMAMPIKDYHAFYDQLRPKYRDLDRLLLKTVPIPRDANEI